MKKLMLLAAAALCLASCSTVKKTATTYTVDDNIRSFNEAELTVKSEKITYTYRPEKSVRRGGAQNIKNAAVREALQTHGNADVLVAPQFETKSINGIFRHGIRRVTVSGYPATYTKFEKGGPRK
ncbi:MAG: hypothetical protein IJ064_01925 [Bacteroidaceae bacterium]|nr:hypothetical protein [Bacteroidaceae bacterium]